MAALSGDVGYQFSPSQSDDIVRYDVDTSATLYQGAALSFRSDDGTVRALNTADGRYNFAGFVMTNRADNSAGNSRAIKAEVRVRGVVYNLPVTSAVVGTVPGTPVYASTSGDFTLSAASGVNVLIGTVIRPSSTSGYADVLFVGKGARELGGLAIT